jgi:putative tricarboxylic transport membrane protein
MADRIVGLLLFFGAVAYAWMASRLEVGFFADTVGPKPFPYIIGAGMALSSLYLMLRPDPSPSWPGRSFWLPFALVLLSLVAYAYLLVPLGFIIATSLEMILLSLIFGAKPLQAALGGMGFSGLIYLLFTYGLGVPLPVGKIFG